MTLQSLTLLPAIDLMDGKCVRLSQGKADQRTNYSEDPVGVARGFQEQGAEWIHLVDLDGAFQGTSKNLDSVKRIREALSINLELGGGVRDAEAVARLIELGIDRVVIGTWAARKPDEMGDLVRAYGEAISVGIDAKDGMVAVKGWTEQTNLTAENFAQTLSEQGVKTVNATDIATDGMMTGPATEFLTRLAKHVPAMNFIASGGIRSIEDLAAVRALGIPNITGVIVGRALYTGELTVADGVVALRD